MIPYQPRKGIKRSSDTGFWSSYLKRVSERECGSNPPIITFRIYKGIDKSIDLYIVNRRNLHINYYTEYILCAFVNKTVWACNSLCMPYQKKGMEMIKKKLKKFENAKIDDELKYYANRCLERMKTGMTLSIQIHDNHEIIIMYYKN